MVPEMEKPRVTEIKVRMDCNGCVHKIKKALHGITGIYDLYVDFPQQKITIIGWADPEKIVKAIKKTRKSAIICSHTEQSDQPVQPEAAPEGGAAEGGAPPLPPSPPQESNKPPTEQQQTEAELQKESPSPPPPPPPDNPPSDANLPPEPANDTTSQSSQPSKPNDNEQIHVVYRHPPDYGHGYPYGGQWNAYPSGPGFRPEPPRPVYVTHSYNAYKPSPYVTEYAYPQSQPESLRYSQQPEHYNQVYPSQPGYSHYSQPDHHSPVYYSRPDPYSPVYYSGNNINSNGNITSMFSEENPNACSIV